MTWTPEMVDALIVMARRRCSRTAIAETLSARYGTPVTSSAAGSKAWREGVRLRSHERKTKDETLSVRAD